MEKVASFEADTAGSGLDEAQDQTSQRAFARSRFADQSESFAGVNVERDIVDGPDFAFVLGPCAERGLAWGINFGQISDFDKRHGLFSILE
jgi:hypothetical protein